MSGKKVKYGIVLSGGGARGYAHIGVLKALHEKNIFPEVVAGTSAGSIAGAFYCDGKSPEEIFEILKKNDINGTLNLFNLAQGFLKHDKLKMVLEKFLINKTFDQLKYPLFVNATDYTNSKEIIFSEGTVADKVIASSTIPIIFEPAMMNGIPYVDGGLANNLLAQPIRPLCEILIGVHVNPIKPWKEKMSIIDNVDKALHMGIRPNMEEAVKMCDIFIEPPQLAAYRVFDSEKIDEIYKVGYDFAKDLLEESGN